jgi:hypothetical protein
MKLTGESRSTRGKICPSATLSTTNPTWTDLGSNPGPRDGSSGFYIQLEQIKMIHTIERYSIFKLY